MDKSNESLWIERIQSTFLDHSNHENAKFMAAYMKNQFSFYGIKTPQRKALVKQVNKEFEDPKKEDWSQIALQGFRGNYNREIQYAIGDMLRPKAKKVLLKGFLPVIEELIQLKSWWDTVDWLSPKLVGGILWRYPEEQERYPDVWIHSENKWLVRSAILFQLSHKDKMDTQRLQEYCLRHRKSKEFFIPEAMGWVLLEYPKTNRKWVVQFFANHDCPKLTIREGSKYL